MKRPTIQIIDVCDGSGEPSGYYAIGHFQQAFFRREVLATVCEGEGVTDPDQLDAEIMQAIQDAPIWKGYWRTIKLPHLGDDEELYETVPKGKRGSYPVTVMHVSW